MHKFIVSIRLVCMRSYNTEEETEPNLKGILDISKCSIVGKSSRHSGKLGHDLSLALAVLVFSVHRM